MGRSGWKKRVANSQTTAGSFQDHEKTTTVDGMGIRLDFFTDTIPKFIFDNAVKPDRHTTTIVNTGNMILLRTATRSFEEDPQKSKKDARCSL
jgi:hypothetical protein